MTVWEYIGIWYNDCVRVYWYMVQWLCESILVYGTLCESILVYGTMTVW